MNRFSKFLNAVNPIDMFNANQMQKLEAYYKNNGLLKTTSAMFDQYFSRRQTEFGPKIPNTSTQDYVKKARIGLGAGIAGYALSQTLFEDTFVERAADFAAGVGIHTGIGAGLYGYKPALGIGYGAWAGLNLLRRGNNFGPF